jgi:TrfA protein
MAGKGERASRPVAIEFSTVGAAAAELPPMTSRDDSSPSLPGFRRLGDTSQSAAPSTEVASSVVSVSEPSAQPRPGTPEWADESNRLYAERVEREEKAKVYYIGQWQDDQRAIPTNFIACALFAGIQGKDATYLDGVEIANANGLRITFKGKRLTQTHADVWEGIMHLARQTPEGSTVRFRARQLLRLIGRHTGKSQRDQLHEWITDLVATNVEITDTTNTNKKHYFGSLVPRGVADDGVEEDNSLYAIEINRDLAKLFASGFATVNWDQRRRLQRKPLALWLQHYFSKFTKPVSVTELHRLAGSNAELKEFRRKLRIALGELQKEGVVGGWRIDERTDAVCVVRPSKTATPSQVADTVAPPAAAQRELLLPTPIDSGVTDRAKDAFRRLYPNRDPGQCLAAFGAWIRSKNIEPKNPDALFLDFAKKWAANS